MIAANDNDAPFDLADLTCTECACCGRPLTDSQSAERGIGPDCFGKYYDKCSANADLVTAVRLAKECNLLAAIAAMLDRQDARSACNVVIRAIAANWESREQIARIELVHALGFTALANRLEERAFGTPGVVTINEANGRLTVKLFRVRGAAFAAILDAMRRIPSRRWDGRLNTFAIEDKAALWAALCTHLAGRKLRSAKGEGYVPGRMDRDAA